MVMNEYDVRKEDIMTGTEVYTDDGKIGFVHRIDENDEVEVSTKDDMIYRHWTRIKYIEPSEIPEVIEKESENDD